MKDYAQNAQKTGDFFLLQNSKETISANTYENGEIKQHKTFPIPENVIYTTDHNERVAILDIDQMTVAICDIHTSNEIKLSIPDGIKPKCMLLDHDKLFVGGQRLMQYHIQSGNWYQPKIPRDYAGEIEELQIYDNCLLTIGASSFVTGMRGRSMGCLPMETTVKCILCYPLKNEKIVCSGMIKWLDNGRLIEEEFRGRLSSKYLGMWSSSGITLYGVMPNLIKSFRLYVLSDATREDPEAFFNKDLFSDFAIIEDKVVIASEKNGLALFEINESYFEDDAKSDRFMDTNCLNTPIVTSYKKYNNEKIIHLSQIPNTTKIVITLEHSNANVRHEIIDVNTTEAFHVIQPIGEQGATYINNRNFIENGKIRELGMLYFNMGTREGYKYDVDTKLNIFGEALSWGIMAAHYQQGLIYRYEKADLDAAIASLQKGVFHDDAFCYAELACICSEEDDFINPEDAEFGWEKFLELLSSIEEYPVNTDPLVRRYLIKYLATHLPLNKGIDQRWMDEIEKHRFAIYCDVSSPYLGLEIAENLRETIRKFLGSPTKENN